MDKDKKKLEQAQRKRERERRRYQESRKAGFSPKEAKSIKKTLAEKPELIQDIESISPAIAEGIENLTELIESWINDDPKPGRKKKKPEVKYKAPKKKKLTEHQRQLNKEAGAFKRFLHRNPDLTQREALRLFREQGHTMGAQRGGDIYREYKGIGKQETKRTRFRTYAVDKNPAGAFYFQGRYMYMMAYTVLVSGTGEYEERYMTVASDKKLKKDERIQMVLDAYDQGELDQNEYYAAIYVDEDSIYTVYMVDTHKKTDKFAAFEKQMRAENPDMSISAIYRAYRASKKK